MTTQPSDQLRLRARRILTDGRRHAPAARRWATRFLGWRTPHDLLRIGFTEREVSLGADRW